MKTHSIFEIRNGLFLKCGKALLACMAYIFLPQLAFAQATAPFTPLETVSYMTRSTNNNGATALYKINLITQASTLIGPLLAQSNEVRVNAIGYNVQDNFIYGAYAGNAAGSGAATTPIATNDIVKIDSAGKVEIIDVPGLPVAKYEAGDIDAMGRLYLYVPSANSLYRITLSSLTVDTISLNATANLSDLSVSGDGSMVWGLSAGNGNFVTYTISNATGTRSVATGVSSSIDALSFYDSRGNLFVLSENTNNVYLADVNNGNTEKVVSSASSNTLYQADGAHSRNVSVYTNAQPAFGCQAGIGYVYSQAGDDIYQINANSSSYTLVAANITSSAGGSYNNMGYNNKDGYMWMHRNNTRQLARIGSDYSVQYFPITDLPDNMGLDAGGVDNNGIFYLMDGENSGVKTIHKVDLDPQSATYLKYAGSVSTSISLSAITDLATNPVDDHLYGVTANGNLMRIDATSGQTTNLGATGVGGASSGVVIAFMDPTGSLFVQSSGSSTMYKIPDTQNGNATASVFKSGVTSISSGDGARCSALAFDQATLPVTLTGFSGAADGCNATLQWQIASGGNISRFEVEHSATGNDFIKVGEVAFSEGKNEYRFNYTQKDAIAYYRLKMVERDGQSPLSKVVAVKADCLQQAVQVFPNPATNDIYINGLAEGSKITLLNQTGQRMVTFPAKGSSAQVDISSYASGLYIIMIETPGAATGSYKIIKQ